MKVGIDDVGFSIHPVLVKPPTSIMMPEKKHLYVKFDIPWLDMLPGFKVTEKP